MAELTKRQFFDRRRSACKLEQSTFINHWKELSDFILPRRGRFFIDDRNKGTKRYQHIINPTATQSVKTSRAGLLSGVMSPSRIWFQVGTQDMTLMDVQEVRVWLDLVYQKMNGIFAKSNLYSMASTAFGELVLFGTAAMSDEDDDEDVSRFYTHTIGSYLIGQNDRYEVDTFIRDFEYTVGQLVSKFGYDNCSVQVQNLYDKGDRDTWIPVTHYVGPNSDYDEQLVSSKNKKFASCYYECGNPNKEKFLSEKGFDEFPVYVMRWDMTAEDIWGTDCPGMVALGDVKQLQVQERRRAQAIDKMVNPPLKGPASLRNSPVSSLPGGLTLYDGDVQKEGLEPIYKVDPRLQEMSIDTQTIEKRIKEAFFVDLFFAITQMEGVQPRNQLELNQRNQERLLQLGPVLERLHTEFLKKLIERTFNKMARKGMLPPAPQALQGQALKVDFVSPLAMAQKTDQVDAINNIRLFISELAQSGQPDAVDKLNSDESINQLSIMLGVPPTIIRSDEAAAQIRQQRQQQQQQQQDQAQQQQLTEQLVNTTRNNI